MKQIDRKLAQAIEEFFGPFLRSKEFQSVPTEPIPGWGADRVAYFDCHDYRLIFERGRMNDISVVVRSPADRLRGGALPYLIEFLDGGNGSTSYTLQMQADGLERFHGRISDLISGRGKESFQGFRQWVEVNWKRLSRI